MKTFLQQKNLQMNPMTADLDSERFGCYDLKSSRMQ